jgi:MFS family permease
MIMSTFAAALLVFATWVPARDGTLYWCFAAFYGIFSGALLSVIVTLATQVCPDVEKLGAYMGAALLAMSPGLLITLPIGGALARTNLAVPYQPVKVFCGLSLCMAGALFLMARKSHLRGRRAGISTLGEELPHFNVRITLS